MDEQAANDADNSSADDTTQSGGDTTPSGGDTTSDVGFRACYTTNWDVETLKCVTLDNMTLVQ